MNVRLLERAPLLPLVASFAAGIAAASWLVLPAVWLAAISATLLLLATVALGSSFHRLATLLLLASVAVLGAWRTGTPALSPDHVARQTLPPTVSIEGRISEEPIRWTPDRMRVLLDVDG